MALERSTIDENLLHVRVYMIQTPHPDFILKTVADGLSMPTCTHMAEGTHYCPLFTLTSKRHIASSFYSLRSFLLVYYPLLLHFILPHFIFLFSLLLVSRQWHIC